MSQGKSYYEVLEVSIEATLDEIKAAYKRQALKYHPDTNPQDREGASKKFKEINRAYAVLSDPVKRRSYDTYGSEAFGTTFQDHADGFSFHDFFSSVFDFSGFSDKGKTRGKDRFYDVTLTLEEVFFGKEVTIDLDDELVCIDCKGSGAFEVQDCVQCSGNGVVVSSDGFFTIQSTCRYCHGTGQKIMKHCARCNGRGVTTTQSSFNVNIPPGVDNDLKIKVPGKGHISLDQGKSGDLYIVIKIKAHKYFQRKGNDLFYEHQVDVLDAILGTSFLLVLFDQEEIEIRIAAGTQHQDQLCLKHKGLFKLNSNTRGNLYVVFKIVMPRNLSIPEQELFQQIRKLRNS